MDLIPEVNGAACAIERYPKLAEQVRTILLALQAGLAGEHDAKFRRLLAHPDQGHGLASWNYDQAGAEPPEIHVLTSLAPGADQLVAEVALQLEGFVIRAPLAFPKNLYRECSTFVWDQSYTGSAPNPAIAQSNQRRQKEFDDFVAKLNPEDVFTVLKKDDVELRELPEEQWEAAMANDVNDPVKADARFRAASEFVGSCCDIVISINDDEYDSQQNNIPHQVIQSKRKGFDDRLLSITRPLNWRNTGPVLQLRYPRSKHLPDQDTYQHVDQAPLRILHPYALGPAPDPKSQEVASTKDLEGFAWVWKPEDRWPVSDKGSKDKLQIWRNWQMRGNTLITRKATNLWQFSALAQIETNTKPDCAAAILQGIGGPQTQQSVTSQLERLCAIGKGADALSTLLQGKANQLLKALFVIAILTTILASLYSSTNLDPENPANKLPLALIGIATVALFWWGLFVFRRGKKLGWEKDQYDYRALAEGLRVQSYWTLIGLPNSARANYLARFHSEMDWIGNLIQGLMIPGEKWIAGFRSRSPWTQYRILREAQNQWVQGQRNYFRQARKRFRYQNNGYKNLSLVIALVGLQIFILVLIDLSNEIGAKSFLDPWLWGIALLAIIPILVTNALAVRRDGLPEKMSEVSIVPHIGNVLARIKDVDRERNAYLRGYRLNMNFLILGASATLLTILVMASLQGLASIFGFEPFNWMLTLMELLLLSAGFLVAYSEEAMHSEYAYRYGAMESMFNSTDRRMEDLFDIYHQLAVKLGVEAKTGKDESLKTDCMDSILNDLSPLNAATISEAQLTPILTKANCLTEFQQRRASMDTAEKQRDIDEIQRLVRVIPETRDALHALLYEVGGEALNENGDWLVLHRARPMEPVMPG